MSRMLSSVALSAIGAAGVETASRTHAGSLLKAWSADLDARGASATATPVTRVVNLLKEMAATLQKDADDDEALYHKLACWCNNGQYSSGESIEASQAKISELEATIESLTSKSAELGTSIQELEQEAAADKQALAEATAQREKEQQAFHGGELDSIQAIENLKAALTVLSKHHGANAETPWGQSSAGSLLQVTSKDEPWTASFNERRLSRSLDDFMSQNDMRRGSVNDDTAALRGRFLQQGAGDAAKDSSAAAAGAWSVEESALVRRALRSAAAFSQAKHGSAYMPSYHSQSGEIVGVLKQLKEEMEGDLSEAQKNEAASSKAFAELRAAKTSEIENGEAMAEKKEDEKATTDNDLAEAKEDLGQETAALNEAQVFLKNMKATCAEADKNYEARKAGRLEEMQAISETIGILTEDGARDAMAGTYGFVQLSSRKQGMSKERREAVAALRRLATKAHSPSVSMLATTLELDSFTKVKKAIADMIAMLKTQQEQEVKKNDWCKAELQENEMTTARTESHKADLETKIAELAEHIKALEAGIAEAHKHIQELTVELQRATEDRVSENMEYQKTVADQTVTIEVLKKALDRLATFYDSALIQQKTSQTPPVPQMEYKHNAGSTGVMQMIEKLVYEAKDLVATSKKAESEAQTAYETLIADTNNNIAALQEEVVSKTKAKAQAEKDKLENESNVADTVNELEGLANYNGDLHKDCDYVMKNFMTRQSKRADEIEALQQATQILSGASLA